MRYVILACIASLAACGDVTGPEDVAGTYILHTVNGVAPPVVVAVLDDATRLELLEGEIVLSWDPDDETSPARHRGYFIYRSTDPFDAGIGGPSVTVFSEHREGSFTVDGRTVTLRAAAFGIPDYPFATLRVWRGTLTWQVSDTVTFVYRRE